MRIQLLEFRKQKEIYQVLKFGVVGALCVVFDMFLFILLIEFLHVNYLAASFSSTCLAILLNYFISKKWVFRSGKHSAKVEFIAFMAFSVAGLLINQGLIWMFVEQITLDPKSAKLLAIMLVALFNFITKKLFVFKG